MKTIWKFPLVGRSLEETIAMPEGAEILCVQVQDRTPTLWASVDPSRKLTARSIYVVATGDEELPLDDWHYIGTYQMASGALIYHVFAGPDIP